MIHENSTVVILNENDLKPIVKAVIDTLDLDKITINHFNNYPKAAYKEDLIIFKYLGAYRVLMSRL